MPDYRLSPRARRDLESIWDHTRQQWDADQADHYTDMITAKFEALANAPFLAPACDHIRKGYRRVMVERHMIYFRVTGRAVVIMRILHGQMDAARHL